MLETTPPGNLWLRTERLAVPVFSVGPMSNVVGRLAGVADVIDHSDDRDPHGFMPAEDWLPTSRSSTTDRLASDVRTSRGGMPSLLRQASPGPCSTSRSISPGVHRGGWPRGGGDRTGDPRTRVDRHTIVRRQVVANNNRESGARAEHTGKARHRWAVNHRSRRGPRRCVHPAGRDRHRRGAPDHRLPVQPRGLTRKFKPYEKPPDKESDVPDPAERATPYDRRRRWTSSSSSMPPTPWRIRNGTRHAGPASPTGSPRSRC